jgi:hypothetical protein
LFGKQLLNRKQLRDKHVFFSFCRARCGVLRPDVFSLKWQLSKEHIRRLIESRGSMILYQHLGAAGRGHNSPPYFDGKATDVFKDIADRHRRGIIWVASTLDILIYALVSKNISVTSTSQGDFTMVQITAKEIAKGFGLSGLKNISFRINKPQVGDIRIKYGNYLLSEKEYQIFHDKGLIIKMSPKGEGCQ